MKKAINSKPTCITDREVLLGTGGGKSCKGKRKTGTKKKWRKARLQKHKWDQDVQRDEKLLRTSVWKHLKNICRNCHYLIAQLKLKVKQNAYVWVNLWTGWWWFNFDAVWLL